MKITIGEWKTRDGRKAIVAAENPDAEAGYRFIGWLNGECCNWHEDGVFFEDDESDMDLIAPWTYPVPWDWSTTPPWVTLIVKGPSGFWYLCDGDVIMGEAYMDFGDSEYMPIPTKYSPKWSGDWKLSKTMRPGYKEVK